MQSKRSDYSVRLLQTFDEIERTTWDELLSACPDATVFQSYEWLTTWWHVFGKELELRLFAAFQNEELIAAAPMFVESAHNCKTIRFVGREHADYNTFIWRAPHDRSINVLLNSIVSHKDFDSIILEEVAQASVVANQIINNESGFFPSGFVTVCPKYLNLPGNFDRILNRKSVKRKLSKLRGLPDIEVSHTMDLDAIRVYLPAFFSQHIKRWHGTPYPSLFERSENRSFYTLLSESLGKKERIVFTRIRTGNVDLAFHFGLKSNRDLIWYKPSFNTDFGSYSPGQILLIELIRYVHTEDLAALDYTRGDEPFKRRFSTQVATNSDYFWHRSKFRRIRDTTRSRLRMLKRGLRP